MDKKDDFGFENKVSWKGGAVLAPVPAVLVTCEHKGKKNAFTVAWTGTLNTVPPKTYISVRPERYSYGLIKESGEFVINLTTKDMVRAVDFCGVRSGREIDKISECGLSLSKGKNVGTPIINESPLSIECKVVEIVHLGSHDMFVADVVGVDVAESLIDEKGRLNLKKAGLIAYSHGEYFELGKKLGSFGYSVKKKKNNKNKNGRR